MSILYKLKRNLMVRGVVSLFAVILLENLSLASSEAMRV